MWAWDSGAYGTGAPTGSRTVNLRFAGQYYDAETGLYYNMNRYYSPATGRYVSSDPIGLDGGLNPFSYAAASPVMYVDPEGLTVYYACKWVLVPVGGGKGMWVKHCWVKTDSMEAGYGYDQDTEASIDAKVVDHTDIDPDGVTYTPHNAADEECVNERLKKDLGTNFGTWMPGNTCWDYANDVIGSCLPHSDQSTAISPAFPY